MGFADYSAYLSSPEWAAVKARYRASDLPQDCMCGATEALQLHHVTYERVGEELLPDLTPLCAKCHALVHVLEARGEIGLDFAGLVNETRAARHRAEVAAIAEGRAQEPTATELLDAMPLYQRVRQLELAHRRGANVGRELAAIRNRCGAAERKIFTT